jgi:mannose-6-phosphate isomerase-like protein (cupin superfamily)
VYIFKARAGETDGHYSLFEARTVSGGGVPLHYHTLDEETFYVLEGTYQFEVGDESLRAGRGECLHIPRPIPHAFRNVGDEPGKMLVIVSPGGYHEAYFDEAWEAVDDLRDLSDIPEAPDMEKVGRALEKAGMRMLASPESVS